MRIVIPNWRPPKTIVAYCDESCNTKHKFFVIGSLYFIPNNPNESLSVITTLERELGKIKTQFHLNDTIKWTRVPKRGQYLEGYKEVLAAFLDTPQLYFRCMVLDTSLYPLDHRVFMSGDSLTGFLKFYCVFLADGLMKNKSDHFFDIRIDRSEFRPGNDSSDLERTVEGRFVKRSKPVKRYADYCKVTPLKTAEHNLLQLTDLLVGAVGFIWNGGLNKPASNRGKSKTELVALIQEKRNVDLSKVSPSWKEGFNIWRLQAK